MWMLISFTAVDEDAEKVLSCDLEDSGEDIRRCILCWHYGDSDTNVRVFTKHLSLFANNILLNGKYFFTLDISIEMKVYV